MLKLFRMIFFKLVNYSRHSESLMTRKRVPRKNSKSVTFSVENGEMLNFQESLKACNDNSESFCKISFSKMFFFTKIVRIVIRGYAATRKLKIKFLKLDNICRSSVPLKICSCYWDTLYILIELLKNQIVIDTFQILIFDLD